MAICIALAAPSALAQAYRASETTQADQSVTLTGHDLTAEQLVQIARYGAKVEVSPEARQHQQDALGLLLEAAVEGVPVDGFNRGSNPDQIVAFEGDPASPDNVIRFQQRQSLRFQAGAVPAGTPEVAAEDSVRALLAVRANTLVYMPATAPLLQMLLDMLNDHITPVVASPDGTLASAPAPLGNVAAAMVGQGEVHYQGRRMPAAEALRLAKQEPVAPSFFDDHALIDTDAAEIAAAALVLADGRRALDWADLVAALELDGQGGSLAPVSLPAQGNRPYLWLNWEAARIVDMLRGSYLFTEDPARLSGATGPALAEQGAAWQAWGALRDTALVALNSSDQTPAVRVGLSPREAPELSTPQLLRFYVKGGRNSGGKRGFIVPTGNRAPAPLIGDVAAFSLALDRLARDWRNRLSESQAAPTDPAGISGAAQSIDTVIGLLGRRLNAAATAMDRRLTEDSGRALGPIPTAVLADFRKLPRDAGDADVAGFLRANSVDAYFPKGEPAPGSDAPIPLAQEKNRR